MRRTVSAVTHCIANARVSRRLSAIGWFTGGLLEALKLTIDVYRTTITLLRLKRALAKSKAEPAPGERKCPPPAAGAPAVGGAPAAAGGDDSGERSVARLCAIQRKHAV